MSLQSTHIRLQKALAFATKKVGAWRRSRDKAERLQLEVEKADAALAAAISRFQRKLDAAIVKLADQQENEQEMYDEAIAAIRDAHKISDSLNYTAPSEYKRRAFEQVAKEAGADLELI